MKINIFRNLFNKKAKANDLSLIFTKEKFCIVKDQEKYPNITPLVEDKVYAYRMFFCTKNSAEIEIVRIINQFFKLESKEESFHDAVLTFDNESVAYHSYNDFGGSVIRLITNSEGLIRKIWAFHTTPPPPWVSFPHIDPDGLGSMQGNLSFWWDWMWLPFWKSMDASEQKKYLIAHSAPSSWVEYFEFYENYINEK
ncbi:hypothetical protein KWG64_25460 (plasmid) [Rahnella sp. PD12R]|uniref:hypothetical protein n=1 Tax=Rahnella sp. PD12R TaxID=2855688 RepID=UPI001C438CE1|nr:hypothetical protein [Rahnella sp. PD12R]MBV6821292.1 hypothetical protein [Rahnella sp. PD12R]